MNELIQCYLSGQIPESAWQERLLDPCVRAAWEAYQHNRINSGSIRITNLAKSRLLNAMRTFKNNIKKGASNETPC